MDCFKLSKRKTALAQPKDGVFKELIGYTPSQLSGWRYIRLIADGDEVRLKDVAKHLDINPSNGIVQSPEVTRIFRELIQRFDVTQLFLLGSRGQVGRLIEGPNRRPVARQAVSVKQSRLTQDRRNGVIPNVFQQIASLSSLYINRSECARTWIYSKKIGIRRQSLMAVPQLDPDLRLSEESDIELAPAALRLPDDVCCANRPPEALRAAFKTRLIYVCSTANTTIRSRGITGNAIDYVLPSYLLRYKR